MTHGHRLPVRLVTAPIFRVLALAAPANAIGFASATASSWADALERLADAGGFDAVVADGDALPASPAEVAAIAERAALVIVVVEPDAEVATGWLRRGADDVIGRDELAGASGWRRVRFAIERRRRGSLGHAAYSTDPGTGLPHRQQLLEHLSQLLALREREPAPMAVLALRIDDLRTRGDGTDAAIVATLRRKIAVRLRAAVRASDVVAAIDDDGFAVLLGSILAPADAERVATKLVAALLVPFAVGADERAVAIALGIAHYPRDGQDAERLLRRALSLAAVAPATAQAGPATVRDGAGAERAAANDDR
jgi:diguanylate cyclase (GGDEF)-like protein